MVPGHPGGHFESGKESESGINPGCFNLL